MVPKSLGLQVNGSPSPISFSRFFSMAAFLSRQRGFSPTRPHALTVAASAMEHAGKMRAAMESETSRTQPAVCGHCSPLICTFATDRLVPGEQRSLWGGLWPASVCWPLSTAHGGHRQPAATRTILGGTCLVPLHGQLGSMPRWVSNQDQDHSQSSVVSEGSVWLLSPLESRPGHRAFWETWLFG